MASVEAVALRRHARKLELRERGADPMSLQAAGADQLIDTGWQLLQQRRRNCADFRPDALWRGDAERLEHITSTRGAAPRPSSAFVPADNEEEISPFSSDLRDALFGPIPLAVA